MRFEELATWVSNNHWIWVVGAVLFPVLIFLLVKLVIKTLIFIYVINFRIAAFFSPSKSFKESKNNNNKNEQPQIPNVLINNKDFDSNCLINLKLMEMMDKKDNNRSQTDLLELKHKMLETYFNQKIFELEMKQKIKELEEKQEQSKADTIPNNAQTFNSQKNFWDKIPETLKQVLEKLNNIEEMQFEILQDYTKKTYYSYDDRVLYVHPEDFLHINKALGHKKQQQLKN
ncbi:hypothetical protein M33023_05710 [Candidatus Phytoplasma asteris]|uniref:Transmembrane protein n=3 Tax=16SrI (Aster yellows group) TaxID=3042590 RepID=Q2NIR7_AYWBP|nr:MULTISPECIES: hypothetical protein [16SrI (Aster yellows group)]ABC65676.1 conserved hypothetical protein [Aster yellows witches'-broom phytoplasma AYWB]PEH36174.1 hypothetical protein BBA70_02775 [New Jersey aster yellows phytoplasma]